MTAKHGLPQDRLAIVRSLFDRIQKAIKDRGLEWTPVLRPANFSFQRRGGYNCAGASIRREVPIGFWIKLPLSPELRQLGQDVPSFYPALETRWDAKNKSFSWAVPTIEAVPDVAPPNPAMLTRTVPVTPMAAATCASTHTHRDLPIGHMV
jgi:hypothetical protein